MAKIKIQSKPNAEMSHEVLIDEHLVVHAGCSWMMDSDEVSVVLDGPFNVPRDTSIEKHLNAVVDDRDTTIRELQTIVEQQENQLGNANGKAHYYRERRDAVLGELESANQLAEAHRTELARLNADLKFAHNIAAERYDKIKELERVNATQADCITNNIQQMRIDHARIKELEKALTESQTEVGVQIRARSEAEANLERLHGARFSERNFNARNFNALKSRAERAEQKLCSIRGVLDGVAAMGGQGPGNL